MYCEYFTYYDFIGKLCASLDLKPNRWEANRILRPNRQLTRIIAIIRGTLIYAAKRNITP